jgi:hypothetical protein
VKFVKLTCGDGPPAWVEITGTGPVHMVVEQTDGHSQIHFMDGSDTRLLVVESGEDVVRSLEGRG